MSVELARLKIVSELLSHYKEQRIGRAEVIGPWGSGRTLVACQTAKEMGNSLLIITPTRMEAEAVYEDLCTLETGMPCILFPAWEVNPEDKMDPADDIVAERMDALRKMSHAIKNKQPICVSAPVSAIMQKVVSRELLETQQLSIRVEEEYDLETLITRLVKVGYHRELMVEQRGEVSVRGGILDVFPITGELPYRIEFFGDIVESIRRFEPETQRSIERVESLDVLPRSEKALIHQAMSLPKGLSLITDYLPESSLIVLDEPLSVLKEANALEQRNTEHSYVPPWPTLEKAFQAFEIMSIASMPFESESIQLRLIDTMHAITGWTGNMEAFWQQLRLWDAEHYNIVICCNNAGEKNRLLEILKEQGYYPSSNNCSVRVEIGRLQKGFVSTRDRLAVFSEREIFGRHYIRRTRRRFEAGVSVASYADLRSGDYVVHEVHGIGRFDGIRRFSGKSGDYLALRYSGGDMLYVPVTRIDLIQKYSAGEGVVPQVDKLGGASWARKKNKVKKAVRDMAERLVKLYAARESEPGHSFSQDTPWQTEFEDTFEYEETPDQARAITELKNDMQSARPMDRLICGDVGYGKTEVALRGAFKAVMDGFQVAVLVPTTILAQQHFATFSERMADFPVRIGLVCRFKSPKENKQVVERVNTGEIDIVIGTHRILSKDVQFRKLGLVIIDEEQKFGVAQKEKLKELRTHVDVVTLSATPIPRTLHLSLTGIRDLSVINTAPNDRLPIHTMIDVYSDDLVKEAIERELGREGQVFYLHNRVQTIYGVADKIHELVSTSRVGIAHGQMGDHDLEQVMTAFIRKEINVLVCTTIIGAGLDIPNANTIIVDRADRFGLAELYQIRGRVGRYKHRAFAYLLVPGDRVPTEDAQKRLKALEEFSSLGAGFRIAMRDLEIRGAGDILGAEQSGHIIAVGYETYSQLIKETVAELRGQPVSHRVLPAFDVSVDAYIPEEYISSEAQKMTLYRRIAMLLSVEEVDEMQLELEDRFGRIPGPVRRLLEVMRVRTLGSDIGAKALSVAGGTVRVEFESTSPINKTVRGNLSARFGKRVQFTWEEHPVVTLALGAGEDPVGTTECLLEAMVAY